MAEESHENFSNFDPAFELERSQGKNQNKPKSKTTNDNNSAEEYGPGRTDDLQWSKTKIDL